MIQTKTKKQIHAPVLLNETLSYLEPKAEESYLDLTAGYAGHAKAILEQTGKADNSVLVDRDESAVTHLKSQLKDSGVQIMHTDFLGASQELLEAGRVFDIVFADLGVSSLHFDTASRGFAINQNGPLDMRMDNRQTLTADEIVNQYSEKELVDILRRYGEELRAFTVARTIIANRPIHLTSELANVIVRLSKGYSKRHPATRTFQALRIAVNGELEQLETALPIWIKLLRPGGRLGVITFHSLEDRIVKQAFAEQSGDRYDSELVLLTKRPVTATPEEIEFNPRARSAKLRVVAKIKTNERAV